MISNKAFILERKDYRWQNKIDQDRGMAVLLLLRAAKGSK